MDFISYPDSSKVPSNFKVTWITNIAGNVITTYNPHGLYPDNIITPAGMVLCVDSNSAGAPASRAVKVLDEYRLELLSPVDGLVLDSYVMIFKWVERTAWVKVDSFQCSLDMDRNDSCSFVVKTTASGFMPYAGMNVLVKYTDGYTLFGGIVKSAPVIVPGKYADNATGLFINVSCDTYNVLAKRRNLYIGQPWANVNADYVVRQCLSYLKQEGVTEGYIEAGQLVSKWPTEKTGAHSLTAILDAMAEISGCRWYISSDKALFFVNKEPTYNNNAAGWEPYISDAPYYLFDEYDFKDYFNAQIETEISAYTNTVHLEGGEDENKREVFAVGRNDEQIALCQYRMGGSGVWGSKIENDDVKYLNKKSASAGTNAGYVVFTTAHNLLAGDYVVNVSKGYKASRIATVNSNNAFTVYGSISAVAGDVIGWYPQAVHIIRNELENLGMALPKKLSFETYSSGEDVGKLWGPGQRIETSLAGFGAVGTGNWITESVSVSVVSKKLKFAITAALKSAAYFS